MVPKIKVTRDFVSTMNQQKQQYETKKEQLKECIENDIHQAIEKILKQSPQTISITNGSNRD